MSGITSIRSIINKQNYFTGPITEQIKFPLLITLCLRLGLSLWIGTVWIIVDLFQPAHPFFRQFLYGVLEIPNTPIERAILHAWVRWDAVHFLSIAKMTYSQLNEVAYNFFPLYPYTIRGVSINGLLNQTWTSLLISTTATFFSLIILRNLALAIFNDERIANWTILVWVIFPTSFFLFAPYSDALFSLFGLGCLYALRNKNWIGAALLAVLAGLTRGQGILLMIPIGLQFALDWFERKRFNFSAFLGTIIAPFGSLAYIIWRSQYAGMLFDGYATYHNRMIINPFSAFIHAVQQALSLINWQTCADVITIIVFGSILLYSLTIPAIRKEIALLSYAFITFGSFLPWYSEVVSSYQSSTRYVLTLYPAFIAIAYILVNRYPKLRKYYVTVSLIFLLLSSAAYTLWIFIG